MLIEFFTIIRIVKIEVIWWTWFKFQLFVQFFVDAIYSTLVYIITFEIPIMICWFTVGSA